MIVWVVSVDGTDGNEISATNIVGVYATEEAAELALYNAVAKYEKTFHDLSFSGHYKKFEVQE